MSVSESHNRTNLRMSREASFAQLCDVIKLVKKTPTAVNVSLSTAMGCPMEGDVPVSEVLKWMERFAELGVHGVTLCDTTGMAYPRQVRRLSEAARAAFPNLELTQHFHNTRGLALANTQAALAAGIERFDASLGGIGGCPYAPGATGNVCNEELVHMLELEGYETGINLQAILDLSGKLPSLIGHDVPSQLLKAGRRDDLHPMPTSENGIPEQRSVSAICT
jgi:hydroxymethylglutaryl-CoA lyase